MIHKFVKMVTSFFSACLTVFIGLLVISVAVTIALAICNAFGWRVEFLRTIAACFYNIYSALLGLMKTSI